MPTREEIQNLIKQKRYLEDGKSAVIKSMIADKEKADIFFNHLLTILQLISPLNTKEHNDKLMRFNVNPEFAIFEVLQEISDKLGQFIADNKRSKGDPGYTPIKGKDYFTEQELNALVDYITPRKGKHYFDGAKGDKGDVGDPGRDGSPDTPEEILKKLLSLKDKLPFPIVKNATSREDMIKYMEEATFPMEKIKGLNDYILRSISDLKRNFGGHGGNKNIMSTADATLTTVDNLTFTLKTSCMPTELEVFRGGIRIFAENGDFATTLTNGRVTSITLTIVLASSETLNVVGKH